MDMEIEIWKWPFFVAAGNAADSHMAQKLAGSLSLLGTWSLFLAVLALFSLALRRLSGSLARSPAFIHNSGSKATRRRAAKSSLEGTFQIKYK